MSEFFGLVLRGIFDLVQNYPIAIILLTILVKVVLLPLSMYQLNYSKRMNLVQPKLKELQTKYKNDKEKLSAKMQELYKEHKVNPFSGCLPIIIQFPILIGLFNTLREPLKYVFPKGFEAEGTAALGQTFLWVSDLSKPDFLANIINLGGVFNNLPGVLPILAALTTYIQMAMMNNVSSTQAATDQMKMMARIMPFMILFMGYSMPAGLMIYWTVGNVFQIIQQYITNNYASNVVVK